MTGADLGRFALIVALGFLAFLTFLYAGTIVGLMWLESSRCNCLHLPVGLYVLALLWILFIASMISEGVDLLPSTFQKWVDEHRNSLIIALIFIFVIFLILL